MTRLAETVAGEHRIVLRLAPDPREFRQGMAIALSCACLRITRRGRPRHAVIEARMPFPAAEVIAAWRDWHAGRGITP